MIYDNKTNSIYSKSKSQSDTHMTRTKAPCQTIKFLYIRNL